MKLPLPVLFFAFATVSLFTAWGDAPKIIGDPSLDSTNNVQTFKVKVNPGGLVTTVTFTCKIEGNPDILFKKPQTFKDPKKLSTDQDVSQPVSQLDPGTYLLTVTAVNDDGKAVSQTVSIILPKYYSFDIAEPKVSGNSVTLSATITSHGLDGTVVFHHGATTNYDTFAPTTPDTITLNQKKTLTQTINFERKTTSDVHHYRLEMTDKSGATTETDSDDQVLRNRPPTAKDDEVTLPLSGPIDVLDNDSDKDGDKFSLDDSFKPKAKSGSANITKDGRISYVPDSRFRSVDTFTYQIKDSVGATAQATVTVHSASSVVAGSIGTLIKDKDGKTVGYLRLLSSGAGPFSAKIDINGKSYALVGTIDPNGQFHGIAKGDDGQIPVSFTVSQDDKGSSIDGSFAGGKFEATGKAPDFSHKHLVDIHGRYTVELPAGSDSSNSGADTNGGGTTGTSNTPQGVGWATIKLNETGEAKIKGKLADGRAFSTRAFLSGNDKGTTLSFYSSPRDSVLIGTLTISNDKVIGNLDWNRPESGDIPITASGGPYVKPKNGQRSLQSDTSDGTDVTLTLSGGNLSSDLSRNLKISEGDDVKVVNEGSESLKLKIDRKGGTFKGSFDDPRSGDDRKITGVLLQQSGTGVGLFKGGSETGKVQFALTNATPSTPGTSNPGTNNPGTNNPGTNNPGTNNSGNSTGRNSGRN